MRLGFCTNLPYVEWWNSRHPEAPVDATGLQTPEEYYRRIENARKSSREKTLFESVGQGSGGEQPRRAAGRIVFAGVILSVFAFLLLWWLV